MGYENIYALDGLRDVAINSWIGPIFLIMLAGIALTLLLTKSFRALIIFLIIAAIAAIVIYGGPSLFGKNGVFTKTGQNLSNQIGNGSGDGAP